MSAPGSTASDHLLVLHARHRRPARRSPLLRRRQVLLQATFSADADLHPLRTQVRAGARRTRGGDPAQRRPQRPHRHTPLDSQRVTLTRQDLYRPNRKNSAPDDSTPSPATKPASSSPPVEITGCARCSVLALHAGLRKGELLDLHWDDIGLTIDTGAIRRTLQRTNAGGLTTLPPRPGPPNAASLSPPAARTH